MTTATSLTSTCLVAGTARKDSVLPTLTLSFTLLVNEVSGEVCGYAQISDPELIVIPGNVTNIGNITGHIQATGAGSFTRLVSLQGAADMRTLPPPELGTFYLPFQAQFAIDDAWDGVGGWTLGGHTIDNVAVHASVQEEPKA
jgi:hypothetical protein